LHLQLTTSFVYFSTNRQLDLDSMAILASQGEHLPYSLYYDQDYCGGAEGAIKDLLRKGCHYLFRSGTLKNDLDSAAALLMTAQREADKTGDLYWRHAVLAILGRYYLQAGDSEKSQVCFTQAVDLCRKMGNSQILARALANRGTYAGFNDPQKEKDLNESLQLVHRQRDTVAEIELLTCIYEIYFVKRKFDTVRQQLLHVTELEKTIGFRHIHYNHNVLSYLYYVTGDYANVFVECRAAVAAMEATEDFAFSNFIYGAMANIYVEFDDYEKALLWLEKSLRQEPANKAKRIWYPRFSMITLNMAKNGHPQQALDRVLQTIRDYPPVSAQDKMHMAHVTGYCYFSLDQRDLAKKLYDSMMPYLDSLRNDPMEKEDLFSAYMDLARFRFSYGDIGLTKKYFQTAKTFADTNDIFSKTVIHKMQYKLDSSAGNYMKALNEYRLTRILDDSMYTLSRAKQISELTIQYQTETKDKNIEILVQKNKVQLATLRHSDLIKNLTLAGIGIMMFITGLVYVQYRNKQKRNEEMNQKNLTLEQLVKDKEWLVKEIHHRVKNNFHTVASLLEIQSSYLKNKEALSAIRESQHRIHSMSIIHQKLYQSETLSTIHMPEYIYELVEYLRESYAIRGNIVFTLDIESIELNHSVAITLGLILNEAITNAIKYAFEGRDDGKIFISLNHISTSQTLLSIVDNGRGLPAGFKSDISLTMGMELLQGLTDDIGGHFSIGTQMGTQIKIIF